MNYNPYEAPRLRDAKLRDILVNYGTGPTDTETSIGRLVAEVRLLRDLFSRVLNTLQDLYDCQNGPPLLALRHKESWEAAMAKAEDLLNQFEGFL